MRLERRFPSPTSPGVSSGVDVEAFAYDANSNVIEAQRRDGQVIGFDYDALGRVTLRDLPGTAEDVFFAYDLLSRVREVSSPAGGTIVTNYDAASRRARMIPNRSPGQAAPTPSSSLEKSVRNRASSATRSGRKGL